MSEWAEFDAAVAGGGGALPPSLPPLALVGDDDDDDDLASTRILYETLLRHEDVVVYKRVKRQTMALAHDARTILAEMVGGTLGDGSRSNKEFVNTPRGRWRVSMGYMSDNSTEAAAHARMGVRLLHLSDPAEVKVFLRTHGLEPRSAYITLVARLKSLYR